MEHDRADVEQKKIDLERSKELFDSKLIAAQDYEAKKVTYDLAVATLQASERKVEQANAARAQSAAQLTSAQRKVAQSEAMVTRSHDVLSQYDATAPLDGVVTNLPVRVGETVVPGIQNSAASTIMTIADMSIITAEVKVDETDIVNVKLDQTADVTIDAIPDQTFKGTVIEIGDTAILRSTGVAASQSADFEPGGQGFQSRDRARYSRKTSSGPVFPAPRRSSPPRASQRPYYSDSGPDHPPEGRARDSRSRGQKPRSP